jgi:organic hydroperoxide reductase OsmC/OhrA
MSEGFTVALEQRGDYAFDVLFDDPGLAPMVVDENPPLGDGTGPNPARLLAAAVAHCLSASLLFALRKFGNEPGPLRTSARVHMARNERGRLRIARIAVELRLLDDAARLAHAERALAQFEDFCIVTQSVRGGVPVDVRVLDRGGAVLHGAEPALEPA